MDFVVAGLGLGALVVVLGFAVRDLGPHFWRPSGYATPATRDAERERWVARCQAVGTYSSIAGGAILVATALAVAIGLSDGAGMLVVAAVSVVALAACGFLFYRRTMGIEPGERRAEVPLLTVSTLSSERPAEVASVRRLPRKPKPDLEPVAAEGTQADTTDEAPAVLLPDLPPLPDEAPTPPTIEVIEAPAEDEPEPGSAAADAKPEADDEPVPAPEVAAAQVVHEVEETTGEEPISAAPVVVVPVEEPIAAEPEPVVDEAETQPPAGDALFSSPLLADIGRETEPADLSRGFSSRLLADVAAEVTRPASAPVPNVAEVRSEPAPVPEPAEPAGEDTLIDARPAKIR